jgi:hypothetical protein
MMRRNEPFRREAQRLGDTYDPSRETFALSLADPSTIAEGEGRRRNRPGNSQAKRTAKGMNFWKAGPPVRRFSPKG